MELNKAISQISEIHAQVLRSEVFRGYRALPMAITSCLAAVTAVLQATLLKPATLEEGLWLWIGYAAVCGAICGADLLAHCWIRGRHFREQAVLVVSQFVPALVAGIVVTAVLMPPAEGGTLLPGLWALIFALGIFSSLPYLPRALVWVAAFYLVAGGLILWSAGSDAVPIHWSLGATFMLGQAAVASVLRERTEN